MLLFLLRKKDEDEVGKILLYNFLNDYIYVSTKGSPSPTPLILRVIREIPTGWDDNTHSLYENLFPVYEETDTQRCKPKTTGKFHRTTMSHLAYSLGGFTFLPKLLLQL